MSKDKSVLPRKNAQQFTSAMRQLSISSYDLLIEQVETDLARNKEISKLLRSQLKTLRKSRAEFDRKR